MNSRNYWKTLCDLPKYSFLLGEPASVRKVADKGGQWVDIHNVQEIVDNAEVEIHELRSALDAFLTYYGMDEDDWSKPVFEKARNVLN